MIVGGAYIRGRLPAWPKRSAASGIFYILVNDPNFGQLS